MPPEKPIAAKESTLIDSIACFKLKLSDSGFTIVERSSLNPISDVWSVHIRDEDCALLECVGHGLTKNKALADALSTFIAHLATHHFWANCYFGDEISNREIVHFANEQWFKTKANGSWPSGVLNGELGDELRDFYNPLGELNPSHLIDANSANASRGVCCIPYTCVETGESVNFPINIIANLYADNGIAAGLSIVEARSKALAGILARYVQAKVIAEGIALPTVPDRILNDYPNVKAGIQQLKESGLAVLVQDASLGGKYPVIAITVLNPEDQGVKVSFAAHPRFETALESAFTTLFKGQNSDQLTGFAEAGFDMDEIASPQNLGKHFLYSDGIVSWAFLNDTPAFSFFDWSDTASYDVAVEFDQLCNVIHAEGNDIFITDISDFTDISVIADHDENGIYACRIIVPGMSEIYPIEDLVWENNNAGMNLRELILNPNKSNAEIEKLIEDLEDLDLDDDYPVVNLIGMKSDSNTLFEDLSISELITLLALKVRDNERIQEGCEWLIHYKNFDANRLKTYQCINTLLQLDGMTNYSKALEKLYSRSILNNALALIDGEDVFPLVSDWKMHRSVIDSYKKLIQ